MKHLLLTVSSFLLVGLAACSQASEPGADGTESQAEVETPDATSAPVEEVAPEPLDEERCITSGGRERCYLISVPANTPPSPAVILDMHGYTGDALGQRAVSGFAALAEAEGVVMVWPDGVDGSFNAGLCCGTAVTEDVDDVAFLREIIADVDANVGRTDPERQFLTGLSNGCAMSQRAAAEASDLFDGVACMSYYLLSDPAADYQPIPIMELHGESDAVVAYTEEGVGISDLLGVELGARTNIEEWAERNTCGAATDSFDEGYTLTVFADCAAPTELVSVPSAGHLLYAGFDTSVDTTALAWNFLFDITR